MVDARTLANSVTVDPGLGYALDGTRRVALESGLVDLAERASPATRRV